MTIRAPSASTTPARRQPRAAAASSTLPWTAWTGGPSDSSASSTSSVDEVAGVEDRVGGAQALDAGVRDRRVPRGMWVSLMIASRTPGALSCDGPAPVAQGIERRSPEPKVVGSIPTGAPHESPADAGLSWFWLGLPRDSAILAPMPTGNDELVRSSFDAFLHGDWESA